MLFFVVFVFPRYNTIAEINAVHAFEAKLEAMHRYIQSDLYTEIYKFTLF